MLNNMSDRPAILEALEKSKYDFHLTGSRFFGTATFNSDYDFFVEMPSKRPDFLKKFLTSLDFYQMVSTSYDDCLTLEVWRRGATVTEHQFDILIVVDAALKNTAQTIIMEKNLFVGKVARDVIWNTVIATLQHQAEL